MESLLHDGLVRKEKISGRTDWRSATMERLNDSMGEEHGVGIIYGLINFIVCVPALVSYAHIVFPFGEFKEEMALLVKLYFLSSAIIQAVFSVRSSIVFSIGQVQDVGLIFLAAMVKNIVMWSRADGLTREQVIATSLWNCAVATVVTGACLILIGKLRLSSYVQLLPLPVVGGYLGYIGYFCLAAGLSIGSGLELGGPETLLSLWDPRLKVKMALLGIMTFLMLLVHFKCKHFLAMPIMLTALPIGFFICVAAMGISIEECRERGWLPSYDPALFVTGATAFKLYDTSLVQWDYLPKQVLTVIGLVLIVAFGSSLDVAAIQAEMDGQKINYDSELVTIGMGNLVSGACGGATGSYIFSQTIFSAKRGVKSRYNGWMVFLGELLLFLLPVDILCILPTSYIGGIMCLFGVDIMNDWLVESRHLMAKTEYVLVWLSFAITMWLTSIETFGVIEGIAVGTVIAALIFALQYTFAHEPYMLVATRSSVIRPPKERKALYGMKQDVMAVSLNSFAFFGASLHMAQGIEADAERQQAKYVCLDFGRLSGMDSTATDQIKQLVLSLERQGIKVLLSSLRSAQARRLLEAHGLLNSEARKVFPSLDQALQWSEEEMLQAKLGPRRRSAAVSELPLRELLLDYVDGFHRNPSTEAACSQAAGRLIAHFKRVELTTGQLLFHQDDPADAIYIVARGGLALSTSTPTYQVLPRSMFPTPSGSGVMFPSPGGTTSPPFRSRTPSGASLADLPRQVSLEDGSIVHFDTYRHTMPNAQDEADFERVGVGAILGDTAFYARRKCGCDAVAEEGGCVAYRIGRTTIEWLEVNEPALMVFLQKVLLRDLTQLQVQYLGPLQAATGLC